MSWDRWYSGHGQPHPVKLTQVTKTCGRAATRCTARGRYGEFSTVAPVRPPSAATQHRVAGPIPGPERAPQLPRGRHQSCERLAAIRPAGTSPPPEPGVQRGAESPGPGRCSPCCALETQQRARRVGTPDRSPKPVRHRRSPEPFPAQPRSAPDQVDHTSANRAHRADPSYQPGAGPTRPVNPPWNLGAPALVPFAAWGPHLPPTGNPAPARTNPFRLLRRRARERPRPTPRRLP